METTCNSVVTSLIDYLQGACYPTAKRDHLATSIKTNYNMLMNEEQIAKVYGNYQNKDATNDLLIENNNLLSKINNKLLIIIFILLAPIIGAIIFWILFSIQVNDFSNQINKVNKASNEFNFKSSQYYK